MLGSNGNATIADLNSVGLKVQHQNGCEGVLGTWPPLLSHLAMSYQGFQEYIYAKYALLHVLYENMQVCNMWAKVTISVSVPQVPNLSILVT